MEKESQTTDYLAALLGDIEAKKAALDALAAAVGAQGGVVNFALVRLVKKGFVRRGEDGSSTR